VGALITRDPAFGDLFLEMISGASLGLVGRECVEVDREFLLD
jgi:hypothetical protein